MLLKYDTTSFQFEKCMERLIGVAFIAIIQDENPCIILSSYFLTILTLHQKQKKYSIF